MRIGPWQQARRPELFRPSAFALGPAHRSFIVPPARTRPPTNRLISVYHVLPLGGLKAR